MIMKRVNRFGHTNFLKACYRYLSCSPLFKGGGGGSMCSLSQSKWYQVMPVELIDGVELLRRGARLATVMRARLYGLFVAHPERFLTRDESLYIETCEHFCRDFGGEFIRVKSANVAEAIAESARQYHITQVILGQSHKSRWEILWKGSLVQKLVRYLKDVDLHIIATEKNPSKSLR